MYVNGDNQVFQGTSDNDNISLYGVNSTVYGNSGNDTIVPYESKYVKNNVLLGGAGNDYLTMSYTGKMYGEADNDTINVGGSDIFQTAEKATIILF